MDHSFKRLKNACYTTNVSMSVVANLSPLLFLTFRSLYGISFSSLGLLVLINFCTQLFIDLVFSFFSHKFNLSLTVKLTPVLTTLGLLVYALSPVLFAGNVFIGLVLGTVLFASAGGLAEVLISPVIAAIPSEHPEREMSKLHSIYAWGVVGVVVVSTLFLLLFGKENWPWLAAMWMCVPILSAVLFSGAKIPKLDIGEKASNTFSLLFKKTFLLCFFCIFLGGASEAIMSQWSSSYLEKALNIPKIWGDVFGVAMFAVMLGLGRTLYAKRGKNITTVLLASAASATVCYAVAAISNLPVLGLIACGLTGLCTAMLWPGNLIVASSRFPAGGVVLFALMAAGGDLGSAVGPQLVGLVTDGVLKDTALLQMAADWGLTAEQAGMKAGLLAATCFPAILTLLAWISWRVEKKRKIGTGPLSDA